MAPPAVIIDTSLYNSRAYTDLDDKFKPLVFQVPKTELNPAAGSELAIYHCDIRAELIEDAQLNDQGVLDPSRQYTHSVAGARQGTDVTSFLESQSSWGDEQRKHFPQITFQWERTKEQHGDFPQGNVPNLLFHGILVVDYDCKPIKAYPDLPLTLSSKFEGSKIEAIMRLDCRIGLRDFLARMPYKDSVGGRAMVFPYKAFCKPGNLSNRARDFRNLIGSVTWKPRKDKATQRIIRFMDARRPEAQKTGNTVRGLRNVSRIEALYLDALNFSTRPERARKNRRGAAARRDAHVHRFQTKCDNLGQPAFVDDHGVLSRDLLNEKIAEMYPAWEPTPPQSPSHGASEDNEDDPDGNSQTSMQENQSGDVTMQDVQRASSSGWEIASSEGGFNDEVDDSTDSVRELSGDSDVVSSTAPHTLPPFDVGDLLVDDDDLDVTPAGPSQPHTGTRGTSQSSLGTGLIDGSMPLVSVPTAEDLARVSDAEILVDDTGERIFDGQGYVLVRLEGKNFFAHYALMME